MSRKIEAMHELFGHTEGRKCKECYHFVRGEYHDKTYQKCKVYGMSHSGATDWAQKWPACGQFSKPYIGPEVMGLLPRSKADNTEEPLEGQTSLFEGTAQNERA